jgi:predicted N-acetyltransferase YhbS
MLIQRETSTHVAAIRAVTAAAFARPGQTPVETTLVDELRASDAWLPMLSRFGFRLAEEYGITPPVPEWRQHFQVRTLTAYTPALRGQFKYAEPFDRV